tara:strand:- start:331 stop:2094 length:1764 start_codon:yes stop_codon:yes gene_type:complete
MKIIYYFHFKMDKILTLIHQNNVTFLQNPCNKEIQDIIQTLHKQEKPVIIFTSINQESLMGLHAQLNYNNIDNQMIIKGDNINHKLHKEIILCEKEILFDLYNKDSNLADIIIFNDSEIDNVYYDLLWQMWKKNKNIRLPRLVLISQDFTLANYPVESTDKNTYNFDNKLSKIEYSNNNYPRNDRKIIDGILDKNKLENNEIYQELVIVPHKRFIPETLKKLKEKYKSYEIYSFDENIYQSNNAKIFSSPNKHRIIVGLSNVCSLLYFKNLYYIYDSCQMSINFYGNNHVFNVSKKTANNTAMEAKQATFRICTQEYFDSFNLVEKIYTDKDIIAKLILSAYCQDRDISIVHEEENIKFLERINLIKAGKVTKRANIIQKSPLGVRASNFICDWEKKKLPLFPALILAVIIDQCKNNLLYTPTVENDKNGAKMTKWSKNDKMVTIYMDIFLSFISVFKDIETPEDKIHIWCQENSIHTNTFKFLITKLKETINYFRKLYNFELALYKSENVIDKAMPFICFNYSEKLYKSHDKINHIYHDNKGNSSILDKKRFDNGHFFFPEKFISLYEINNNNGHNIVLFYIIIED